ncbi:rhodanese-like domain-containing protein [Fusarium oxysporum f. sp. phaseoli]
MCPSSAASLEPRVIPLCVSWFPDNDQESRTGIQTFCQKRIPEARFFDLDIVIDTESPFPRLLPSALGLASSMSGLGIRKEDILVVYDTSELGIFSAPRVGWMLKVFGHPKVHILNNFRLEMPSFKRCIYPVPTIDKGKIATYEEVREAVMDHNKEGREGIQILDSRSSDDFSGKYPGPRPDSLSGHMPGSINIPYDLVLDTETKAFLPSDQLAKLFETKGVDPLKPIISSGTSITAYVIETALQEAQWGSSDSRKVYDGSWSEWTQRVRASDYLVRKTNP